MVFDGEEIPETYYTKQSRVPKLRAFSIATSLDDFAASGSVFRSSPAPFSITLSIDDFWLISHEDESDDPARVACCTGTSPLEKGRKVGV